MRIIGTKDLCNTKYVKLVETYYGDNDLNSSNVWVHAERTNKVNAVQIVATIDNLLVVTKEFRLPIQNYVWGFPAGLLDKPGEGIAKAVERELKEETGLDLVKIKDITPLIYSSPGLTNEGSYYVYVVAKGTISDKYLEGTEEIKTMTMSKKEIQHLLYSPDIIADKGAYLIFRQFAKYGET